MRCFKCLKEVPARTDVCPFCGQVLIPKAAKRDKKKHDGSAPVPASPAEVKSAEVKSNNTVADQLEGYLSGTAQSGTEQTDAVFKGYNAGDVVKDRYEIKIVLGSRGIGHTYKANDRERKEMVVLKWISPSLIATDDAKKRLLDVLKGVSGLGISEIAAIYDYGEDGGAVYFVTEYIEGLTLRKLLDVRKEMKQPFRGEEIESILTHLSRALITAHNNGVVHGNLKPANIFVLPDGVKITDMGISSALSPLDFTSIQHGLGEVYKYIAPEVVIGGALSKTSDIFSLGIIVYEMLTGVIPSGVINPPSTYNAEVPEQVNGIVLKSLQQDRAQRTQTVNEIYKGVVESFGRKTTEMEEISWLIEQIPETDQTGKLQTDVDEELLMYVETGKPGTVEVVRQKDGDLSLTDDGYSLPGNDAEQQGPQASPTLITMKGKSGRNFPILLIAGLIAVCAALLGVVVWLMIRK